MFYEMMNKRLLDSALCVGIDPNPKILSDRLNKTITDSVVFDYCKGVIDATAEYVCSYKPQIAYFSAFRWEALLEKLIEYIHVQYPMIPVILDAKRGDIADTALCYAKESFERYQADAVTLSPYMGLDTIDPFLTYQDKGVFILCKTSNQGSGLIQDEILSSSGEMLYLKIASKLYALNNKNVGLVVGATHEEALHQIQERFQDMLLLIPGVGHQNASIDSVFTKPSQSIINVSRGVLYGKEGDALDFLSVRKRCQYYFDQIQELRF